MFWLVIGVKVGLACIALFTPRSSDFGLVQAVHSIPTLPMFFYKDTASLEMYALSIHDALPFPHPGF